MALKSKISDDELALLECLEDPIWAGELLRSTANGETSRALWPKQEFSYRWYQKDWLTDTSPYICVTAGRAVGKHLPLYAVMYN